MKTETIMAKFGLKAVNCEPHQGGKAVVSAEEQLAMVGLKWHDSPVGFSILFAQYLNDQYAANVVFSYVLTELFDRSKNIRPKPSVRIQRAMATALVCEVVNPYGIKCPECSGTGLVRDDNKHTRKCHSCNDGFINWNINTRYATVYPSGFLTFESFSKLHSVYLKLIDWLYEENTKAETLLHKQFKEEKAEAKLEQAG